MALLTVLLPSDSMAAPHRIRAEVTRGLDLLRCGLRMPVRLSQRKGGDPMSHGARPITAALASLVVLLTAGIALACPSHKEHTASTETSSDGTVASSGSSTGG